MLQMDVVIARFPYSNLIDYKIRPALIVSNDSFNSGSQDFWICPITSKGRQKGCVELKKTDFSGDLKVESFIRTDVISTIEKDLVLKKIGRISRKIFKEVIAGINNNLAQ